MSIEADGPETDNEQYKQCLLERQSVFQVSFVPTKFAVVGRVLKIKNPLNQWEDGWVISEVYGSSSGNLILRRQEFQRRMKRTSSLAHG